MRLIAFTDLDDTLLTTTRKVPLAQRARVAAFDKAGEPSSFQTPAHQGLWDLVLAKADQVIPTTARSAQALARVQLPFVHGAIVDFGATLLLPDGGIDYEWNSHMRELARGFAARELFETVASTLSQRFACKSTEVREANGVPCFVNVRLESNADHAEALDALKTLVRQAGLGGAVHFHGTDRDLCVLPSFVSKGYAVDHWVRSRGLAHDLLMGLGDNLSDVPFLNALGFAVLPTSSQAAQALGALAARKASLL